MDDPAEHALVLRALGSRLSNCVLWKNDRTSLRVRNDPTLQGLTPEGIKRELLAHVAAGGRGRAGPRDARRVPRLSL